ncbi:MAG: hypothetical protein QXU18_11195, partial [Thermoplasmatales archaeon]
NNFHFNNSPSRHFFQTFIVFSILKAMANTLDHAGVVQFIRGYELEGKGRVVLKDDDLLERTKPYRSLE